MSDTVLTPEEHAEIIRQILTGLNTQSREEWFSQARSANQGGPGFNPMRQLQTRLRHEPSFAMELWGIFFNKASGVFQRLLQWPPHKGWRLAKEWFPRSGSIARQGIDWKPYYRTEPLVDDLDDAIRLYGLHGVPTMKISKQLVELCCDDLEYNPNQRGSANIMWKAR
jgi:hypothetical protein